MLSVAGGFWLPGLLMTDLSLTRALGGTLPWRQQLVCLGSFFFLAFRDYSGPRSKRCKSGDIVIPG